eukprot:7468991-Pyramimonas_sp.AAC.1
MMCSDDGMMTRRRRDAFRCIKIVCENLGGELNPPVASMVGWLNKGLMAAWSPKGHHLRGLLSRSRRAMLNLFRSASAS